VHLSQTQVRQGLPVIKISRFSSQLSLTEKDKSNNINKNEERDMYLHQGTT